MEKMDFGMPQISIYLGSNQWFSDSGILFGKRGASSKYNALNIVGILKCIELSSDLKVNLDKSCLYGVGTNFVEVDSLARKMRCKAGKFSFTYLGLPIGAILNSINAWQPVIKKFKSRLSNCKMCSMSFGGRLVLIKSVLNGLPLYYFSLFRASPSVIKTLEILRRDFVWGGGDSGSKIS
ncbi:uncharacterized protein [Rutidosis leptorrhynchoides]|uniref:uncharacterized protein n=1 Tax=Rutidosis leptorrhynchoides TaxID=125765 RepID=UPI003A9A5D3F